MMTTNPRIARKPKTAKPVRLDMTGPEFKTLIERVTGDGEVNTIPELMALVQTIPDGMTLEEFITTKTADAIASDEMVDSVADRVMENVFENITEDDLENIFFGPEVTGITVIDTGARTVLIADTKNIGPEEEVTWKLVTGSLDWDIDSAGSTLTLTDEQTTAYRAAQTVTASLQCSDYESEPFTLKE